VDNAIQYGEDMEPREPRDEFDDLDERTERLRSSGYGAAFGDDGGGAGAGAEYEQGYYGSLGDDA
jgi:hypothetical protein